MPGMANSTDGARSALLSMTQIQQEAGGVVHSGCVLVLQDVNEAFEELEEGNEDALKVRCIAYLNHWILFWACISLRLLAVLERHSLLCQRQPPLRTPSRQRMIHRALLCPCLQATFDKQVHQLSDLIDIINGELTKNDRKKLITLCTIDVHARDVVQRLIDERVENMSCFQWQSQLRYYQNEKSKEAQVGRQLPSQTDHWAPPATYWLECARDISACQQGFCASQQHC